MKKFSANEGGGVGGMRILGSDNFYDKSSKISSLPPPPKVMNNDQFLKYICIRENNRSCSNSYVKLDITKILQRKC